MQWVRNKEHLLNEGSLVLGLVGLGSTQKRGSVWSRAEHFAVSSPSWESQALIIVSPAGRQQGGELVGFAVICFDWQRRKRYLGAAPAQPSPGISNRKNPTTSAPD